MMHHRTWQRIIDTELYGNTYRLSEYATDLTDGIFKADLRRKVNYRRQNLQTEYVNRLTTAMRHDDYSHVSKAEAFRQLQAINKMLSGSIHRILLRKGTEITSSTSSSRPWMTNLRY